MASVKLNIPLPSKGLVVDRPGEYVDSRAVSNIMNMEVNRSIIRKRVGTVGIGASLGERIMRYFELQSGSNTRLCRVGLGKIQSLNKKTGVWSDLAYTPLTGTSEDIVHFAFPLLSGSKIVVYTNGVDPIRKVTLSGSDDVLGGSPPRAKYLITVGPYLLLANILDAGNEYTSRVQWCDTGLPETWIGGNAGSTNLLDDTGDITGVGLVSGYPTIHKQESIYLGQLVNTDNIFSFERKATGVGTCASATIVQLPDGSQIFLATDGLHIFNGSTAPILDIPIQDELREEINASYIHKSHAVLVKDLDEYWLAVPIGDQTEPETIYKYNYRTGQVYKDYRAGNTAMGLFFNTVEYTWADMNLTWATAQQRWNSSLSLTVNPTVILGDSSGNSYSRSSDTNDDHLTNIEAIWETKDFGPDDFGIPDIDTMMRWKGIELWAKGDDIAIYYSIDSGETWIGVDTFSMSDDYPLDSNPMNIYFDVVSSKIRFRFRNVNFGETFTIKKYQLEASKREARK